jgi:hypothetical protein
MSPDRMNASSVAHKSTGGTLQSLPEPVDPVGDAPDYLTFKTVAPLRHRGEPLKHFSRAVCEAAGGNVHSAEGRLAAAATMISLSRSVV